MTLIHFLLTPGENSKKKGNLRLAAGEIPDQHKVRRAVGFGAAGK